MAATLAKRKVQKASLEIGLLIGMPEVLDRETIKALGTETRQEIMKMLARRPYTASEISKVTGKHVTTVAEHLIVLEKSGLVRKRESTNKWVYYGLTDKGEHLFKPRYYSFVIVFSLSLVLVFVGALRIFSFGGGFAESRAAAPLAEAGGDIAVPAAQAAAADYTGLALILLGLLGIAYLAYRKWKS